MEVRRLLTEPASTVPIRSPVHVTHRHLSMSVSIIRSSMPPMGKHDGEWHLKQIDIVAFQIT